MEGHKIENNKISSSLNVFWITVFFSRLKWNVVNTFTNITESKWGLSILYLAITLTLLIVMIIDEVEGSY